MRQICGLCFLIYAIIFFITAIRDKEVRENEIILPFAFSVTVILLFVALIMFAEI